MYFLSGLILALIGFLWTGIAEEQEKYTDYSDDLSGYCQAVANLNYIPATRLRLKTAQPSRYLVLCKTQNQDIDLESTKPSRIVRGPENRYVLVYDSWDQAAEAVVSLKTEKGVLYAEHDTEVKVSSEDGSGKTVSFRSKGATRINLEKYLLLAQQYGVSSQTVAVIDSGVSRHSLLNGRIKSLGYDYVDADNDPTNDLSGHGTHVAGIIADCTMDTQVWIYPVRVLNSVGSGKMSNVVSAVLEAIDVGVDVINLSLESFEMSEALDDAIEEARDKGTTVVIAAGNSACDTSKVCPAHLTGEGIIVVGSVEGAIDDYQRADYSNYGSSVDLYAFGSEISSCSRSGGYVVQSGTSMAAAHVSGVCALIGLINSGISPQTIEKRLISVCQGTDIRVLDTNGFVPISEGFYLTNIRLCVGDTLQVPVAATPIASNAKIDWISSNDDIISIDNGVLHAKNAGTVLIKVRCMGFEETQISATVIEKNGVIVTFPSELRVLSEEALMGTGCQKIVIEEGLESVGNRAFANCKELQTVIIPKSVTEIEEKILDGSEHAVAICKADSVALTYAIENHLQYIVTVK